ncbi:acVLRF1 family peptidyl-tRNA hydrolase [uncultured Friedmanniella sp.]|uniref:acVLRF1 family peptidyl-tRNA hydrolase n=1 Tax=uncultured Friedmanniella sp. TaxID=335381 RepID=UPI0035CA3AE9
MADRVVHVPRERLVGWVDGFARRHGPVAGFLTSDSVTLTATDGAVAVVTVPFLPWSPSGEPVEALLAHVARDRLVGAVLVRLGGYAVGRFVGTRLVASKVDSTYVQGRTKAGGWSQQRYARRRGNQAAKAYAETADVTARLLLPYVAELDGLVGGGDAGAVSAVLADSRLAPLRPLLQPRVHPVPDPRLRVLEAFPEQYLAVEIALNELA